MKPRQFLTHLLSAFCALGLLLVAGHGVVAETQATLIELTQTGCQFLEPEGKDHQFKTTSAGNCNEINKQTAKERLNVVKPLRLKPGKYRFRITNKNVPYPLGFWLRGKGLQRVILPSVSGGGLSMGNSGDYEITLTPGNYVYSCPLNPTPDYPVVVE